MITSIHESEIKAGKTVAIISHLTILGCIIAIFMNIEPRNKYAGFYIKQTFALHLFFWATSMFATAANSVWATYAFWLTFFVLWVYSFVGAISNELRVLPGVGKYFQSWFKNLSA
ncbi:MAG: hypothetical protein LBE34_02570 [Flavobacteriaceae bacterium]|jgi:uncharacterized membrane protein|nr:hypothetical protein [Flavobacteriaceae bacterium]